MDARANILISGHVQGVSFRKAITELARRLKLTGWVRNLTDGRVEAIVEGEKSRLETLIEFCHVGPPGALVRNVKVEWSDHTGEFQSFRIVKLRPDTTM